MRRRGRREISEVLDTALAKLTASEYRDITDHDREWAQAIRYWLRGHDEEESVRLAIADRLARDGVDLRKEPA